VGHKWQSQSDGSQVGVPDESVAPVDNKNQEPDTIGQAKCLPSRTQAMVKCTRMPASSPQARPVRRGACPQVTCLPSSALWAEGLWHRDKGSKMLGIFLREYLNKFGGNPEKIRRGSKYFYKFARLKQRKTRYCGHPMSRLCPHGWG
jgi:hypothetical protein